MKNQAKIKNLLKKLLQLHDREIDLSLDRIRQLTNKLGTPQDKLKIISISGTNGKGSIAQIIRSILENANYKCDLYSSPSVKKINERFIFSGKEITDEKLCELIEEVENINNGNPITYFEILTAIFFLGASRSKSDVTILESGLFHRYDACSCIKQNLASVITAIGMDHLDWLPKNERTMDRIIFEKTSKLLNSKIIVSEQSDNLIMRKIKKSLENNSSQKYFYDDFFSYKINDKGFLYKDKFGSFQLSRPSLLGDHQISNAATAIATIRNLENYYKIKKENIVNGLKNTKNIGRLEQLKEGKLKALAPNNVIYLDCCHNELGAEVCAKFTETLDAPVHLVLAMMKNKEHKNFISKFKDKIHSVQACDIPNQLNCIKKEKLNQIVLEAGIKSECSDSAEEAIKKLVKEDPNGVFIICGSIYFLGEILDTN